MPEVHRAAATVTVTVPADRVAACTWSSWAGPDLGCRDLAEGVPTGAGFSVDRFADGVTLILGEAPLMESVFVACDGPTPVGAHWVTFVDRPATVALSAVEPPDPALRSHLSTAEADTLLQRICTGDPAVRRRE